MELSIKELQEKLNISGLTASFFKERAIDTPERLDEFLNKDLSDLEDPLTIPGIYDVTNVINDHIERGSIITVFGDFDVDGTTATTIMYKALTKVYDKDKINILPSDRYRDGYGLSYQSVDIISDINTDLLITLDCGISNHTEIDYAQMFGMDVVVIDHHESKSPPDVPYVDLKVSSGNYSEQELCGAGAAWRVGQVLTGTMFEEVLDLVTLATIADLVPLVGENRIIVKEGLKKIRNRDNVNTGIQALIEQFDILNSELNESDIGFLLGPAINAVGRLGNPKPVIKLLNTESKTDARRLAFKLYNINESRKNKTKKILEKLGNNIDVGNVIVEEEKIIRGVVGLVAGKIQDRYKRPTIIIDSESKKGSARSMEPFNMYDNLDECHKEGLLESFGGHSMAAGLRVEDGKLEEFRERLNDLADGIEYETQSPDLVVQPENMSLDIINELELLAPYGMGHPRPFFEARNIRVENLRYSYTREHIFFDANGISCALFFQPDKMNMLKRNRVNFRYEPSVDTFNEWNDIQFIVREVEIA